MPKKLDISPFFGNFNFFQNAEIISDGNIVIFLKLGYISIWRVIPASEELYSPKFF